MGFGILFIGYFLLLNFTYGGLTDALAAILLLYGLYSLSKINKPFKIGAYISAVFSVFGIFELAFAILEMFFSVEIPSPLGAVIGAFKYLLIGSVTYFMLRGMKDVSREVGIKPLSYKCEQTSYLVFPIYGVSVILEILGIFSIFDAKILSVIAAFCIVTSLVLTVMVLYCTYSCYAKICMPNQKDTSDEEKPSRFGFVNAFRRHEEEKQREYAEYKLNKLKKSREKKKDIENGKKQK